MNYDDVLLFAQNYKNTAPQNGINLNDEEDDDILDGPGVQSRAPGACLTQPPPAVAARVPAPPAGRAREGGPP